MRIFLSYAVRDTEVVEAVQADLERFGHTVWRDVKIVGGQDWWDTICDEIRACDGVVFALSPASARSRYCEAELTYASQLHRPLLPLMIAETAVENAPLAMQTTNAVRIFDLGRDAIVALAAGLAQLPSHSPLPDPVPEPPAVPLGELPVARAGVMSDDTLSETQQRELVAMLRRLSSGGEETALELVRIMRSRSSLFEDVAKDLDRLLEEFSEITGHSTEGKKLIRSVVAQAAQAKLTPILGFGLTDGLIGSRRTMARTFAQRYDFPFADHLRDDLSRVAQFVRVSSGDLTLRDELFQHLQETLSAHVADTTGVGADDLDSLIARAWDDRAPGPDPHDVLADLGSSIYITSHPSMLLEHALTKAGRAPVTEVYRWNADIPDEEWPRSRFEEDPGFRPTSETPLVFHVFGVLAYPETVVLTEDDYIKFLIGITSQREARVPAVVRRALADSALLVLGFRLDEWDFRSLWKGLVAQEGSHRLKNYKHIAAQIDPTTTGTSAEATREYLEEYFGSESTPSLGLFWGSVEAILAGVSSELSSRRTTTRLSPHAGQAVPRIVSDEEPIAVEHVDGVGSSGIDGRPLDSFTGR